MTVVALGVAVALLASVGQGALVLSDATIRVKDGSRVRVEILMASPRSSSACVSVVGVAGKVLARVSAPGRFPVTTDVTKIVHRGEMSFCGYPFPLVFRDYNHDGQLDFNIGQDAGSNNNAFWLFTIDSDWSVVGLPVAGDEKCVYNYDKDYSTPFLKMTSDGFETSGYDPASGGFSIHYRWNRSTRAFERVAKRFGNAP